MKNAFFGVAGILCASLFAASAAQATKGWVNIPGAATQVAVGANDIPFVLGTDGFVYYLAPRRLACSNNLCVQTERAWVNTNLQGQRIAVDQYGYLWLIDSGGSLSIAMPSPTAFDMSMRSLNVGVCASSVMPGRMVPPFPEWNYPFGVACGPHFVNGSSSWQMHYTTTYITGCSSASLSSADFVMSYQVFQTSSVSAFEFAQPSSNAWQPVDTGETQVTGFTVNGSATQVPWILAPLSSGIPDVWAVTGGQYIAAPVPTFLGVPSKITYVTDHWIVTDKGLAQQWLGDAFGNRPSGQKWFVPAGAGHSSSNIVQIAYASALPGTSVGTIGPSNLYMVDANNQIFQYGDLASPVK